jgi:conjugative relaxase-like TrwC/TraI family protein
MRSAKAAVEYLSVADYFSTSPGDLIGKGFAHLDIGNMLPRDVLHCLAFNLDPATGEVLRPHAKEGDRVGMDFTFNAPKSVTLARELGGEHNAGDPRVEAAHREAVKYAMGLIEADMQTRVRIGGANEDRVTGNLFAYRVTHRDTRVNPGDQMPDCHLHDHVFTLNLTFDPVEKRFKAAQLAQIKHDAPYFEAVYMNRLATNLRDLGYGIRRDKKAFEITGIDRPLIEKFSRRTKQIEALTEKLKIQKAESKAKLGATTRAGKTKETAEDLNSYYVSRLTDKEKQQLTALIGQPSYQCSEEKAVRFAIGHEFERQSVVEERKLYETALRHGIGSVTPEGVEVEAKRQGALLKEGQVTTKAVLAEESRIIDFAREGKGTMRPLGLEGGRYPGLERRHELLQSHRTQSVDVSPRTPSIHGNMLASHAALAPTDPATSTALSQQKGRPDESKRPMQKSGDSLPVNVATLSPEQQALVSHVLTSTDQVILVRGAAGTGKTHTMKTTLSQIDRPVAILAPTTTSSRGVLRDDGFKAADTVAAFLKDEKWQARLKNGVVYVDEAALLPIKDLAALCDIAREQKARLILQGDPRQHKSVLRNGNMFRVLQEYAGLPVAELKDIRRQSGRFKDAVAAIERGDILKGHDIFTDLKWVKQVSTDEHLVEDYLHALATKKSTQTDRERAIILAPTHEEGDAITAEVRRRLKKAGKLSHETEVRQLVPLHWSEAERGDLERYTGGETLVFHQHSGTFKAGQVVKVRDFKKGDRWLSPKHFAVYEERTLPIAVGDTIRTTANVKDVKGKRIDNGTFLTVTAVGKKGIEAGGKVLPLDVGHLTHGYVSTSIAGQGKTVDKVFAAMGSESLPALKAEQFYVDLSRARFEATIYTDLPAEKLREAIQRKDTRKSATELMKKPPGRLRKLLAKARDRFRQLHAEIRTATRGHEQRREREHESIER